MCKELENACYIVLFATILWCQPPIDCDAYIVKRQQHFMDTKIENISAPLYKWMNEGFLTHNPHKLGLPFQASRELTLKNQALARDMQSALWTSPLTSLSESEHNQKIHNTQIENGWIIKSPTHNPHNERIWRVLDFASFVDAESLLHCQPSRLDILIANHINDF